MPLQVVHAQNAAPQVLLPVEVSQKQDMSTLLKQQQGELERLTRDLPSRLASRDAAEAVWVEYEELPHVVTVDQATAAGAPALCEAAPDNIAAETRYGKAEVAQQAFAALSM